MAIHPENAIKRLASETHNILWLPSEYIPEQYKKEYAELINLLSDSVKSISVPGAIPSSLGKIRKDTAIKYIKLLFDIQDSLQDSYNSELR